MAILISQVVFAYSAAANKCTDIFRQIEKDHGLSFALGPGGSGFYVTSVPVIESQKNYWSRALSETPKLNTIRIDNNPQKERELDEIQKVFENIDLKLVNAKFFEQGSFPGKSIERSSIEVRIQNLDTQKEMWHVDGGLITVIAFLHGQPESGTKFLTSWPSDIDPQVLFATRIGDIPISPQFSAITQQLFPGQVLVIGSIDRVRVENRELNSRTRYLHWGNFPLPTIHTQTSGPRVVAIRRYFVKD